MRMLGVKPPSNDPPSDAVAIAVITILLVLLVLVAGVGAFLYVRYYWQRPLPSNNVLRSSSKQVIHSRWMTWYHGYKILQPCFVGLRLGHETRGIAIKLPD